MNKLDNLFTKASHSGFYKWVLNRTLSFAVPYNRPHRFEITKINADEIEVIMPYCKRNLNHIKGLHACGLATLCEYACGLQLSRNLDMSQYRIIMQQLNMEYFYQGKNTAKVVFRLTKDWVQKEIIDPLQKADSLIKTFELSVYDQHENRLCTGKVSWQIKDWKKVKTNL
jgi:hypothetical protein